MDDENLNKYIGNKIKEYRKKKNLTQDELGRKIGVKHSTISAYERGLVDLNLTTLFQLSDIFGVAVDDLFPERKTQTSHVQKTKDLYSKNLKVGEIKVLLSIFDEAESMSDEERENYIKNLRLATEYHKKMNR